MTRTARAALLVSVLLAGVVFVGCGGTSSGVPHPRPVTESPPPATPVEAPRRDCPAIACGGCSGGYATEPDGCPSCQCLFDEPAVMTTPSP